MQSYSKYLLIGLLAFSGATEPAAAKPNKFFRSLWEWFTSPNEDLDSTYIFQPTTLWTVSLEDDLSRTGALYKTRGHIENLAHPSGSYDYLWDVKMQSEYSNVLGAYVSLGDISLGWGTEVGTKSAESNNNQYFSFLDAGYGLSFRYNSIHNPLQSTLYNYTTGFQRQIGSRELSHFKSIIINAYYALNQNRYAYNAAYDGSYLQRRSCGSVLLMAKYAYGDLNLPKNDTEFITFCDGGYRYSTHQLSVGPGYGYNWVLFHRDPVNSKTKGLRNLTFNATVAPMLTLINRLNTYSGEYNTTGTVFHETDKFSTAQKMHFNVFARAAANYTVGRYSINAMFDFNRFTIHNEGVTASTEEISSFKSNCRFYDWMVSVMLNVRF